MKFIDRNWVEQERQPCAVYTRVMGYLRPVSQFNIGKKSEFYSRKHFIITDAMVSDNQAFITKYKPSCDSTSVKL